MKRKVISFMLLASLLINSSVQVLAETVSETGVKTSIPMSVDVTPKTSQDTGDEPDTGTGTDPGTNPEPVVFSATVPSQIAVAVDSNTGIVTVADNLEIVNNVETKGIKVSEISVETADN